MITARQTVSEKPVAVVAGGAGFIGSFLCETLLLQNCKVICLDNLSSGKKENLAKCQTSSDFNFVEYDLRKPIPLKVGETASYIFDLADSLEVTKNLLDLAEKTKAKALIVTCKNNYVNESLLANFPQADATIACLSEVYGPRMTFTKKTPTVQLIKAAVEGKTVKIFNKGSEIIRPIFISDAVYGLTKMMFGTLGGRKTYDLANAKDTTTVSFAQEIQRQSNGKVKIATVEQVADSLAPSQDNYSQKTQINWKPRVGFEDGIQHTLAFFVGSKEEKPPKEKSKKEEKRGLFYFVAGLLIVIIIPVVLFLDVLLGINAFKKSKDSFMIGDFKKARESAEISQKYFQRLQKYFAIFSSVNSLFLFAEQGTKAMISTSLASEKTTLLVSNLMQQSIIHDKVSSDPAVLLGEIKVDLDDSFYYLSLLESKLNNENFILKFPNIFGLRKQLKETANDLPRIRKLVLTARKGLEFFPSLAGLDKKKTYLVLLQNNHELRPTGGFIGSYALVTIEKGKLIDFDVQDVYWADGQLKGHVEPPPEIKKYLGEASWYLRDSNWNPDFPTSAARARWFLEKETGRVVDGVIGVDLFFAQGLLQAVGEIELPDFKEKINSANLFERAEYYSEVGFFPGSSQKQDFLGYLSRALFEKIKRSQGMTFINLGKAFYDSLSSKDLLVFLNDKQAMESVTALGWSGEVRNVVCEEINECFSDYLMIVEANVGVNKANFFVDRALKHKVEIKDDGTVSETLKIGYKNESSSESLPGGKYKNYLRILVPKDAKLNAVVIDGEEIGLENISQGIVGTKKSFGLLVEVPIKSKKELELSYELVDKVLLSEKNQYFLLLQKQPGVDSGSIDLEFTPPPSSSVAFTKPEATMASSSYFFSPAFDKDIIFEINLVR